MQLQRFLCQYPIVNDRLPGGDKRAGKCGPKADEITLAPLELIDRIYKVFPLLWDDCGALKGGPQAYEMVQLMEIDPSHLALKCQYHNKTIVSQASAVLQRKSRDLHTCKFNFNSRQIASFS